MDYDLNKLKTQPIIDESKEILVDCKTSLANLKWELNWKTKNLEAKNSNDNFIVKKVKATAYYWPEKWQKHYATWSYKWDIKLQWSWKLTASWLKPEAWMIASPKNINLWTKVIIPDYVAKVSWAKSNETIVADRWWAIKWNKVDVFFGHWEEALNRALNFWKKDIEIKIAKNWVNNNV